MKSYNPDVRITDDENRNAHDDEGRLVHLDKVKDHYQIDDGNPDIRGWDVRASEGRKIGKVDDLIIDTGKRKVRYLEVKVEKDIAGTDDDRWMLFPIGKAHLDDDADEVRLDVTATDIRGMPARDRGRFSADDDRSLRERFRSPAVGAHNATDDDAQLFDERRFLGKRGRPAAASDQPIYVVPVAVVHEVEVVRTVQQGDTTSARGKTRDQENASPGTERRPDAR
jgi:sporulation protein YlmC with PRC-barrel domain